MTTETQPQTAEVATKPPSQGGLVPFDYGKDAGAGFTAMTSADFKIPFLSVLQALSPQVNGEAPLPEAKAGMLYDTVSGKLYDGKAGITLVVAGRKHVWAEWAPRTAGGGFRGQHAADSKLVLGAPKKKKDGKDTLVRLTPDGNELVETFYLYAVVLDADQVTPVGAVVLPLTSTKIGPYQTFNTKLREYTGMPSRFPLFAFRLQLTTEIEKRAAGTSYNIRLTPVGGTFPASLLDPRTSKAYEAAKALATMVDEGRAQIDPSQASPDDPEDKAF